MTQASIPGSPDERDPGAGDGGQSSILEGLLRRCAGAIRAVGFRYGLSGAEVDEFEQDIRIRLWRVLERPGEKEGYLRASYVRDAAVSSAVDLLRRRRRDGRLLSFDEVAAPASKGTGADAERVLEVLDRALGELAVDRRVVVRMHLDGRSREEIGTALGWNEARVRNLLYRGLGDLKAALVSGG